MNLYSSKDLTQLLERHGFFFKKNLGQNFLIRESVASRIAQTARLAAPENEKTLAVEIGPGAGSLTYQLCKTFDRVLALEIDPHVLPILEESLADFQNVTVELADALRFDFSSLPERFPGYRISVCANLPYYITSEVIMRLLESTVKFDGITVLIQKEAAERLVSPPGSPDYGSITASVSYYAKAERKFTVGPGNFIPRPKVDSAVLQLIPYRDLPVKPLDPAELFAVIRAAFFARRKTLANALFSQFADSFTKEEINLILEESDISPMRRGETLSLEEFARVADNVSKKRSKK